MNKELYVLRRRHGDSFVTRFLDGTEVPWRPLSLEEFLEFDSLFESGRYPAAQLEDEVFSKCCLDVSMIENIDQLEAGLVTTAVNQIMETSGPIHGPEQITFDLDIARQQVQDFFVQAVTLICQVFPGYTPEEVEKLEYRTFLKRLAMAEQRLMEMGIMTQPLSLVNLEDGEQVTAPAPVAPQRKTKSRPKKFADLNPKPPTPSSDLHVIGSQDIAAGMEAYDAHEKQDYLVTQFNQRSDLLAGLEYIYPDYLQMLNRGEAITPEKIQQVKGKNTEEVEKNHERYVEKLMDGTIKPEVSEPEPVKPKGKKKVIVKRVL